jgi:hypothetical protein
MGSRRPRDSTRASGAQSAPVKYPSKFAKPPPVSWNDLRGLVLDLRGIYCRVVSTERTLCSNGQGSRPPITWLRPGGFRPCRRKGESLDEGLLYEASDVQVLP